MLFIDSPNLEDIRHGICDRILTYGGLEKLGDRCPKLPFFPEEDGVGAAGDAAPGTHSEIMYRANHVIKLHEEGAP